MAVLILAADEHRPKKKDKRNLDYAVSHHYSGPHSYRLERRISTGLQPQSHYPPSQYFPGPPRPYRKDHGQNQQLLNENNHLGDPVDRGGSGDTIYIPHKPLIKVVEKPVYIKEPEPIIEIIIKESNVSLPPPPTEPPGPPPKKKKEEVQVFYVKYKKNPNGYGKDSVIYDKPVAAISPVIPEDPEPEEEWKEPVSGYGGYGSYANEVTFQPPPSTTLRTIIKPDSEVYHSPGNNVKVTFGKEGFDYDKRSSKPEDYPGPPGPPQEDQFPRARQLSSFSNVYFKRPAPNYFPASSNEYRSEVRPPQSYRPFNNFSPSSSQYNSRPSNNQYNRPPPSFFPQPKYPYQSPPYVKPSNSPPPSFSGPPQSRPSFPNFSHSISHPPPPQFQSQKPKFSQPIHQPPTSQFQSQHQFNDVPPPNQRKPVPYTPFENIRPSQPVPPAHQPSFNEPQPTQPTIHHQSSSPTHQLPQIKQNIQFRPESNFPVQPQPIHRPSPGFSENSYAEVNNQFKTISQHQQNIQHNAQLQNQQNFQHQVNQAKQQQQATPQQQYNPNEQLLQQEHLNNLRAAQNIIPPGGELIQSLPKFEQHLFVDPSTGQLTQSLPLSSQTQTSFAAISQKSLNPNGNIQSNKQAKSQNIQSSETLQQYVPQPNPQNIIINEQRSNNQAYANQRSTQHTTSRSVYSSSPKVYSSSTPEPSTTTKEPEKLSTTTKDPAILQAQLPAEVPDDLREQLLASGILNNADISILDYDKVGDIPISDLPPDQLANFYNAGGAQQLAAAGSVPVPQFAALTARRDLALGDQEVEAEGSEVSEVRAQPKDGVEMKVVRYDPETDKGQKIQEAYVSEEAQQVDPVVLNDNTYNRYLPLKVNGTEFPIPDVPELKGKHISSVVVLAPISYDFSSTRTTREAKPGNDIEFIKNPPLKQLLVNPTLENYKKFLESENKTATAKQSVVLLVTGSQANPLAEKEIFMYDIASKTVSKLSGELSSAFVEAAEANSSDDTASDASGAASSIEEVRVPYESTMDEDDLAEAASEKLDQYIDIQKIRIDEKSSEPERNLNSVEEPIN